MKKPANKTTSARSNSAAPDKIRGNMDFKKEITPLIMISTEAYNLQDPGISYDEWRREEVKAAVGRGGLSECDHCHFCALMGHFHAAAGQEDKALYWYLRAAKNSERQIAWSIAALLTDHIALANSTVESLTAATPPRKLKRLLAARESILDHPEGPLNFGDLLTIVRGKTKRPGLTLDPDKLAASLADRCDKLQLAQIRFTMVNRRAERKGSGLTSERNKSQKSEDAKARRSPHTIEPRIHGQDFL